MAHEVTVTVNPRFGRRTWVKLWVNEWLDGTTRFEMTDAQRAFWIDLLAMAGRSRFPGIVCAGKTPDGKLIGYPVNKYQSLMSEPIDVEETLALFVRTGKVRIEVTASEPLRLLAIELLNWNKFQSEYNRQKPYRTAKRKRLQEGDSESDNQSNKTEVEVDVEGEVEGETEKANAQSAFNGTPQTGVTVPPLDALQRLSYRELKGLQTTLNRSIRERRFPKQFIEQLKGQLSEVESLMQKKKPR